LASLYGCFRVHPEYIGVNEKGVVKVGVIGNKINEEEMVRSIVDVIDRATVQYSQGHNQDSIKNFLYRKSDALTFHRAIR
jgi:hypothetical protein